MYTNKLKQLLISFTIMGANLSYSQQAIQALELDDISNSEKKVSKPNNQIGVMHLQSVYNEGLETMGMTSVQYLRKTKNENTTIIAQLNYRTRGNKSSLKYDLQSYFKHNKRTYSYTGISVSDSKMFPSFEAFYSLYTSFNKGWELETGAKFLLASNFNLFTPVIGGSKEFGNNRVTFRNFFTFSSMQLYYGNSLTWKNFLNENRDNLSFMAGFGNAPDSKNIDFSENFISNKSKFVGLGFEKNFHPLQLSVATVFNNNHFSTGKKFNQFDFYANLFYKF